MATPKMLTERQQLAIALRESMSDAPAGAVRVDDRADTTSEKPTESGSG